jgi:PEP-CTERM/exosortase A-associated glycosyltransferase
MSPSPRTAWAAACEGWSLKIVHVLDHSVPLHSGYSFRTVAILRAQRRLGWRTIQVTSTKHEISAVTDLPGYRPPNDERASETIDGFEFHRTPYRRRMTDRVPVLDQWGVVTALRHRLAQVVEDFGPDVVHAHSPSLNALAAASVARRHGLPLVYELRALWEDAGVDHGTVRQGGLRYRGSRALETHVLRRADAIVTICEGLRREIVARGLPESRVTVVPNAVDLDAFTIARRGGSRSSGHGVLGFIGSFYAYEGLALLLDAMPAILSRRPETRLILVGGGFQEEALARRVRDEGLEKSVVFTGRVPHDRVPDYYEMIDVLVYPRLSMRLTELVTPLKPLEAMAYGRLVVASDVGGHKELIRDGETGLLFRAGDSAALAARVLGALELGARAEAIRTAARRFVERERTWDVSVSRYARVYEAARAAVRHGSVRSPA